MFISANTRFRSRSRRDGITLIEVVVTTFISSIVLSGLVMAYVQNFSEWRNSTEYMVLHNEGTRALEFISKFVHTATTLRVTSYGGYPQAKLDATVPQRQGSDIVYRSAEFYYAPYDKSLRWNNLTGNQGIFAMRLCPLTDMRSQPGEHRYIEVERVEFIPFDPIRPGNRPQGDVKMLKVELEISSPRGETLLVTSYMTKFNKDE